MAVLETFPNRHPGRDYLIQHTCPEFTSLCPKTGQPDFGTIRISYVPDRLCVELKSLKLYVQGFRSQGIFYEDVVNVILDDLVAAVVPRSMTVQGDFRVRGGISSVVTASYEAERRGGTSRRRNNRRRPQR
ncbi:MAG TPA: preQ(1) synthase [Vicinamibacteria bacterium]|nr:preQ(1) synthase [Vicinamibacteria bacterium]